MNKEQKITRPKIVFLGTPKFGAIILEGLIEKNFKSCLVITSPDKPVGRKQILTPPPAKISAQKYNIPVLQPEILANSKSEILNSKPDLTIVASFGQIIPKEILEIPKYGCLNVHSSLLPKYRGPSPIQSAILNGDKETGITIILMDEKIDHGPIVASIKYLVSSKATNEILDKELAELGTQLLIETVPKWLNGEIKATPQNESKATYAKILKKEDGKIDWKKPAEEIERQIRAFYPWPGTFTKFENKILKIIKAEVLTYQEKKPGEVFLTEDKKLAVRTGKNCLIIKDLQLEGKKPMSSDDFLKGHPEIVGVILK